MSVPQYTDRPIEESPLPIPRYALATTGGARPTTPIWQLCVGRASIPGLPALQHKPRVRLHDAAAIAKVWDKHLPCVLRALHTRVALDGAWAGPRQGLGWA